MQKATFVTTIPHIFLPLSAYISEANQESSIQSTTSRFCVHETLLIKQSNFPIKSKYPKFIEINNVFVI